MTLGKRMLGFLLALVILTAAVPARAQLIEQQLLRELQELERHVIDVYTFEGVLGTINDAQITVVNEANTVVPVLVPYSLKLDPQYIVGNRVWVELEKSKEVSGIWTLRKIRKLDGETPVPTAAP